MVLDIEDLSVDEPVESVRAQRDADVSLRARTRRADKPPPADASAAGVPPQLPG